MEIVKKPLTKRQSDVLTFIKNCIVKDNLPPTIQDICHKFGFASTNGVSEILKALETKGHIKRKAKGAGRGLLLIGENDKQNDSNKSGAIKDDNIRYINIVGEGNAENPMSIFMNIQGQIAVDKRFIDTSGIVFAFKVKDNSMGKNGITKGDIAILKQINFGNNDIGIVLALVHDQSIIRELITIDDLLELRASEKGYPKIKYQKGDESISLIGKLIGLIKKY